MNKQGIVIYSKVDIEKNRGFVEMLRERFKPYNIDLELIIVEDWLADKNLKLNHISFAINRSRNSHIAKYLEGENIPVFNSSFATEIGNHKAKTYKELEGIVPFMPFTDNKENVGAYINFPVVIKSCEGHGGSQVFLANNQQELESYVNQLEGFEYLIQQCSSDIGKDVRIYVVGNEIIAAVLRTSTESFKSNYSLGGSAKPFEVTKDIEEMVYKITKKIPLAYGGIDFIFHQGKPVFNEIEDAVGARMLYACTDVDSVLLFVQYIIRYLESH